MRKSLAIGTILRSDDNVASAITQAALIRLGEWASARGVHLDYIPCMGAGKDLARAEVLAAFWHKSACEDLLWIDNGNGIPGDRSTAFVYFDTLVALEEPVVWGPYMVRGGDTPSFACSLPGDDAPSRYLKVEKVRMEGELVEVAMLRLGGCGFGWTRMRRDVVRRLFEHYRDCRFTSNRIDSGIGELQCLDLFSSLRRRRLQDLERPDKPVRLEPEDDSFWHRMREGIGLEPCALVDLPIMHGRQLGDFRHYYGLPPMGAPVPEERPRLLDARGAPLA